MPDAQPPTIYKIVPAGLWAEAVAAGRFDGAPVDAADGFIHFSTGPQVHETAARHFAGEADLLLVSVDAAALGAALVYEPSRGGALFPHLYAPLGLVAVTAVRPLPLGPDGRHVFPQDVFPQDVFPQDVFPQDVFPEDVIAAAGDAA